jgi:holliday junction resolvase Hjr
MASNYRAGGDLERAAKAHLEDNGYYVVKSAGSKGTADLVAIKRGEILLIQCKRAGFTMAPAERIKLRQLAAELGGVPLCGSWVKNGRAARSVGFMELISMGPAGTRPWTPDHALADAHADAITSSRREDS